MKLAVKLIGLDIGDRRIGVAFGETELRTAIPVDVIERTTLEQDVRALARMVHEYDATQLVVGLPRNMDGTTGPQAQATQAYAEKLAQALDVRIVFWDERLTTVEAQRRSKAGQGTDETRRAPTARSARRGRKSRRTLDAIAAAIILQDYLDVQANTGSAVA